MSTQPCIRPPAATLYFAASPTAFAFQHMHSLDGAAMVLLPCRMIQGQTQDLTQNTWSEVNANFPHKILLKTIETIQIVRSPLLPRRRRPWSPWRARRPPRPGGVHRGRRHPSSPGFPRRNPEVMVKTSYYGIDSHHLSDQLMLLNSLNSVQYTMDNK